MKKDQVFSQNRSPLPFKFDREVAECFDDMIERSVPFYREILGILGDLAPYYLDQGDLVYDLGCSTATTIKYIKETHPKLNLQMVGVDNSAPMIEQAKNKLQNSSFAGVELQVGDINQLEFKPCGAVILNYTLQFIPLSQRPLLLEKIYQALRPGGFVFISEKLQSDTPYCQELITDLYYDFKRRNGYSETEIAQKRAALENVLIPLPGHEHLKILKASGFEESEMIFRWYNFASFIGIKK